MSPKKWTNVTTLGRTIPNDVIIKGKLRQSIGIFWPNVVTFVNFLRRHNKVLSQTAERAKKGRGRLAEGYSDKKLVHSLGG